MRTGAEAIAEVMRDHGGVITLAEAVKAGLSRHAVSWAESRGLLVRLRHGVFALRAEWHSSPSDERHRLLLLAQQRVNPHLVVCATSAAIVLGLPTPVGPPARPQLTAARLPEERRRGARGRQANALGRRALLSEDEVVTVNGLRVTSPVRTVLDCARAWDRPWGLAIADAALHLGLTDAETLRLAASARPPMPGGRRALWVSEHARAAVESPLESLGRGIIVLAGLPEPTPQVWVQTRLGPFRVDLLDEANGLATEPDGRLKYAEPGDIWREKLREDALRETGLEVVRFTIQNYHRQAPWLASYRAALARAQFRRRGG